MDNNADMAQRYVDNIAKSGLSIYDPIEIGDPNLWIPSPDLEILLSRKLIGMSVYGLPIRRRSKVVKEAICTALGYPVPRRFIKTKPRFPGQDFDTYIQKSNNLQIWNEEISPTRRYVLIRVSVEDIIGRVKVITGADLAPLDTTGTLTRKFQARLVIGDSQTELVVQEDTDNLKPLINTSSNPITFENSPTDYPTSEVLLRISEVYERLQTLVGNTFSDSGYDQERNRGALLHQLICKQLGYKFYKDDGRFPDVRNQLIEIKLQTSPTIDLGLVRPDSKEALDIPQIQDRQIRHCDVRYAVFYASIENGNVTLTHFFLTTGEAFFTRFPQFQGKISNAKLQIPLPRDFFDR